MSTAALQRQVDEAKQQVTEGGVYQHYKTKGRYTVLNIGHLEAEGTVCVIYQNSEGLIWVRSFDDFIAEVKNEAGQTVPRFMKID